MTHRILIASALITVLFFSGTASLVYAQAPAVQKAFEEVKTKLDDLVSAKDENLVDDLALRIQAFKKVVEFSAEEAKTLKVRLLAAELEGAEKETLANWRAKMEEGLVEAGTYYEATLDTLTTSTTSFDLASLKTLATSFKKWRDASFMPLANDIEGFLLVAGQQKALEVAEARLSKIESDVKKLERAKVKGVGTLTTFLAEAQAQLSEASAAYARGEALFILVITPPVISENEEATSTDPVATSTDAVSETEVIAPPSIRDEIRASLQAVKKAYQTFIAMSVEVKKILK